MAQALDLDPGSYRGTYKLIGGAAALDFANLVSYRATARQHDWLRPADNARRWALAAGIDAAVGTDIDRLRDFRELLARVFLALTRGHPQVPGDIDAIGELAAVAWTRRRLHLPRDAAAASWIDTSPSLLSVLALDAAALLTSPEALGRMAACGECRWLFLDQTRNRSRRWCDPADCGNRARQRRHYQRHKQM